MFSFGDRVRVVRSRVREFNGIEGTVVGIAGRSVEIKVGRGYMLFASNKLELAEIDKPEDYEFDL